ncbi:hypothetical protein V5O48_018719, partial [Marasmius crinis-equi]
MTGYLGGALLEGGSDTTSQFLRTMILAMIIYSEVQQKAQAELDRVVGPDRLPTLEGFSSLPYVQAIIRETHRIRPVAPLIPHASTDLEEYNGYLIPEGSIIFVNIWGIYHDPDIYNDPETFNPERYLQTENGTRPGVDGSDLRPNLQFGCGRRICPGIHLAQNSINLDTMRLLWAFTFSRATDPRNGKDIDVSLDLKNYSKDPSRLKLPSPLDPPPQQRLSSGSFAMQRIRSPNLKWGLAKKTENFLRSTAVRLNEKLNAANCARVMDQDSSTHRSTFHIYQLEFS